MTGKKPLSYFISLFLSGLIISSSIGTGFSEKHLFQDQPETPHGLHKYHSSDLIDLFSEVNETRLHDIIIDIQKYGPRPTGSKTLEEVGSYLYSSFLSMGISVHYDSWESDGFTGNNIIARIPGKTDSELIITAHYDTIDVSPGADDDGSGIASILMIAEILQRFSFNQTITFIIFSGEEIGLLGSTDYAQRCASNHESIIGVLSLDKIGYAITKQDGDIIRHHANRQSAWMINISQDLCHVYHNEIGLTVKGLPFDPSSDHRAFVLQGFAGSNLVEEALNPTYHTSEDIIDHMNITYLSKVTKLALAFTVTTAELTPMLNDEDLKISIQGSYRSHPSCLSVFIENLKSEVDSANVSITIQLRHLLRDSYVYTIKEFYTEPCIWNFTKEIFDRWVFEIGPRIFSQGLIRIEVMVCGIRDDYSLFVEEQTVGLLYSNYRFIILPVD